MAGECSRPRGPAIIFVNRFFHPDLSATSQLLGDLAFALAADRRVIVIASRLRYDDPAARLPAREWVAGVDVRRVFTTGFGRAGMAGRAADLISFHLFAAVALIGVVGRGDMVAAKTDPPLISIIAGWVARLRGAMLINWLQDVYPEVARALGVRGLGGAAGRALLALRNASLRRARLNVVLSEGMAAHLKSVGAPPERIRVIPNWTDEGGVTPIDHGSNPLRRAWGLEGKFVVAYSGNLGRAHEYAAMLGAARLLADDPAIVFLIIGEGHHAAALREAARREGLTSLRFQPYQDRADLAASLSAGDLHWISLRPELEGLIVPSKVYGILAAGRPILAVTAEGGEIARLVAEHRCGLRCDPGDAPAFAQAVRALADDRATAARLGAAARAAAIGAFSRESALAKWREALDDAQGQG